jgi:hypothetical protein
MWRDIQKRVSYRDIPQRSGGRKARDNTFCINIDREKARYRSFMSNLGKAPVAREYSDGEKS